MPPFVFFIQSPKGGSRGAGGKGGRGIFAHNEARARGGTRKKEMALFSDGFRFDKLRFTQRPKALRLKARRARKRAI